MDVIGAVRKTLRRLMSEEKVTRTTVCKYCGGRNVVKFGTYHGVQRWWCKDCRRKFVDADTLPKMKTPIRQIASALSGYYGGMSLDSVCRHLEQQYGTTFTDAGVYNWLLRFTKVAVERADRHTPSVGRVFVVDETVLKIGGRTSGSGTSLMPRHGSCWHRTYPAHGQSRMPAR